MLSAVLFKILSSFWFYDLGHGTALVLDVARWIDRAFFASWSKARLIRASAASLGSFIALIA